jgi:hypothetical protein
MSPLRLWVCSVVVRLYSVEGLTALYAATDHIDQSVPGRNRPHAKSRRGERGYSLS